jgi:hypothetical protein
VGAKENKLTRRGDAASGGAYGEDETRVCLAQVPPREIGEAEGQQLMRNVLCAYMRADTGHDVNADVGIKPRDVGVLCCSLFL